MALIWRLKVLFNRLIYLQFFNRYRQSSFIIMQTEIHQFSLYSNIIY
jgi:hypothetical protein